MKKTLLFLIPLIILWGCKSVDMLTVEQSNSMIETYKKQIEENEKIISPKAENIPSGNDVIISAGISGLNRILYSLANNRNDDMNLYFGYSPNIIKEDKKVLTINYTNYVNIDSGFVYMNLKSFKLDKFESSKLLSTIEIEGFGKVSVSGKYTGIPASLSPNVQLYLIEPIAFDLLALKTGMLTLKPKPKKMILKTKISINLLGWDVPWYKEVPLELSDLVKPIDFPITLKSEIQFPLPASKAGDQKLDYAPYTLELKNASVSGTTSRIIYKTDIDFMKKTQ